MKKLKAKIRKEKAYAHARMSISRFASNPLPSPNPFSCSFNPFNGGFPWSLYEFVWMLNDGIHPSLLPNIKF